MIVLHHCVSARSLRPLWMLEELGLPYQLRMLAFPPRVHARPYLGLNPLGTVPLLEEGERQQPQVAADYSRWFLARLRAVDAALQHSDTLCAGRFTAADVAVGYALLLAQHLGLQAQFPLAVNAYWERLQERPAFQNALRSQHEAAVAQQVDPTPSPDLRV